jgi:hypothetical protein
MVRRDPARRDLQTAEYRHHILARAVSSALKPNEGLICFDLQRAVPKGTSEQLLPKNQTSCFDSTRDLKQVKT